MDTIDLEQLVCFSEAGSLSAVAEQFSVSQPSVTRTMQRLEQELGATLFTRTKNKLTLNEVGLLAAEEARLTLSQLTQMKKSVQALDRQLKTINVASCEVFCIEEVTSRVRALFPEMTIAGEIKNTIPLLEGLRAGLYDLVILPFTPDDTNLISKRIGEEHLKVVLPKEHRLAERESVIFDDLNGANMLLYSEIGFWKDVVDKNMPDTRFLIQSERYTFAELIRNSVLPFFTTEKAQQGLSLPENRVIVPISDKEANPSFYLVCKKENFSRFRSLFAE